MISFTMQQHAKIEQTMSRSGAESRFLSREHLTCKTQAVSVQVTQVRGVHVYVMFAAISREFADVLLVFLV